jgi:hypothetical protein
MTGAQLSIFIQEKIPLGQVIYISNQEGYYEYDGLNHHQTSFRFLIPNHNDIDHPNPKYIPINTLIVARNLYNLNQNVVINNLWIINNCGVNWGDCRVKILRKLVTLPEFLYI